MAVEIYGINIIAVILAAGIAGIGSGIGVAIGQALYKAFFEEKVQKFLDRKHRDEAIKLLREKIKNIEPENGSNKVVDNMLGKSDGG
jgi:membrane protein DedA with SNARE-associated domain